MAKKLLPRRGAAAQHDLFTGDVGEITVDTTNYSVVVHDGITKGGHNHARDTAPLRGIKFLRRIPNVIQTTLGYHTDSNVGGGQWVYNPNRSWTAHDGGTVIAYPSLALYIGTVDTLAYVLQWNADTLGVSGTGCWERLVFQTNTITASLFGTPILQLTPEMFGSVIGQDATASANAVTLKLNNVGGGELFLSAHEYIFNEVDLYHNVTVRGLGRGVVDVVRTTNKRVFKAFGPAFNGVFGNDAQNNTLPWYRVNLTGFRISSRGTFSEPLVEYRGVTSSEWSDLTLEAYECNLAILHQVWDSRFDFVEFLGGGRSSLLPNPTPAVQLRSGYGYRQTKEIFFSRCRWESYTGQAVGNDSEADVGGKKTELVGFSQCKMESKYCPQRHVNLYLVTAVMFEQLYVTTYITSSTEPVVNLGGGQLFTGNISVFFAAGSGLVAPKSTVRLIDVTRVDLDIRVHALQPETTWAVDWDGDNPTDVNLNITAPFPTVNGRYLHQKTFRNSTIRQVGLPTDAVQYVLAKDGRPEWSVGNPALVSGAEEAYVRVDGVNILLLRSRGADAQSSYKELIPGGHLKLGKSFNASNLLRMEDLVFWVDSSGQLRRTAVSDGTNPTADKAGFIFQTSRATSSSERPVLTLDDIGVQNYNTTLKRPEYWDRTTLSFRDGLGSRTATVLAYNPPSLTNLTRTTTDVTVNDAQVGWQCICSFSVPLQGIQMWGEVIAANTVRIYFHNGTGSTVDLLAGNINVMVIPFG